MLERYGLDISQPLNVKIGDRYFEGSKPQYKDYSYDILSAQDHGILGNGRAGDTNMINRLL